MSIEQTRRSLNQCDRELVDLDKKIAEIAKKEAVTNKRIYDIQKSITKNTSIISVQSKQRQIDGYQKELINVGGKKADLNKKIADKKKLRADYMFRLQKEEVGEQKKFNQEQKNIQQNYEKRISELTTQLIQQTNTAHSQNNLYSEESNEKYDVFISHASEDKESFADELNKELIERSIKVWYDNLSIAWGDSLRAKIDNGLKNSKYGIVILSNDYIKKGWTQYELDGLFNVEMNHGKTILPIWHNITKKEVQEFSPALAGRKALSSVMMTPAEIAEELVKLLGIN